ncbi:MAG: hypothetical protein JXR88_03230 [Clostridia bacterium]|nr:hypothetical protein [Clostridia bacterium]
MRINNNLMAMNTHRQLGLNSNAGAKSIEKLSSGFRINRAGDDAAGLAISEKMRAQIRGLNQASRNSQDAISLVQTAEGALNETQAILQRMRELAVQSANDTNVTIDRDAIQNEIDQLTTEIDRIGNTTEFNTRKLLNGGAGIQATQTTGTGAVVVSGSADVVAGGDLVLTGVAAADNAKMVIDGAAALVVGSAGADIEINGVTVSLAAGTTGDDIATAINDVNGQTGVSATYDSTLFTLTIQSDGVGSAAQLDISGLVMSDGGATATDSIASTGAVTVVDQNGTDLVPATDLAVTDLTTIVGDDAAVTIDASTTGNDPTSYSASGNRVTFNGGDYDGLVLDVENASAASTIHIDANGSLSMQIGANEGQDMNVSLGDMRAAALGVSSIDITTASSAKTSITTINDAITSVSTERAKLGAVQNRLEHTIKNLDTSAENLQASESRIRDVDMAKEMMEFTKNNILQQAAQAMLAQANNAPQGVLQLLR